MLRLLLATSATVALILAGCAASTVDHLPATNSAKHTGGTKTVPSLEEETVPMPQLASVPEGVEVKECSDGGFCASEKNGAVPNVVGSGLGEACRAVGKRQYRAVVFSAEVAKDARRGHVVEQVPEAGSKPGVGEPVYLGVPGPLPDRLPPQSACPERDVLRNLPGNLPAESDD